MKANYIAYVKLFSKSGNFYLVSHIWSTSVFYKKNGLGEWIKWKGTVEELFNFIDWDKDKISENGKEMLN